MCRNRNHGSLLKAWSGGDEHALEKLTPIVYRELRRMVARALRRESAGKTLQPTALVLEAWLRLVDAKPAHWRARADFFAVCARMLRRIGKAQWRVRGEPASMNYNM